MDIVNVIRKSVIDLTCDLFRPIYLYECSSISFSSVSCTVVEHNDNVIMMMMMILGECDKYVMLFDAATN